MRLDPRNDPPPRPSTGPSSQHDGDTAGPIVRLLRRLTAGLLNRDRPRRAALSSPPTPRVNDIIADAPCFPTDVVACPHCGALYLAETEPGEETGELEDQEWEAIGRLADECPDHASYFIVGL